MWIAVFVNSFDGIFVTTHSNALQLSGQQGDVSNRRFGIVVSSYHQNITGKLLEGALSTLANHGVAENNIVVSWVPGAFELPLGAKYLIDGNIVDAVITLGCVIKGQTTHDHHINTSVSTAIGQMSVDHSLPIAFGLLTCNTTQQAIERSGGEVGNKGQEATLAAIQMLQLSDNIVAHAKSNA